MSMARLILCLLLALLLPHGDALVCPNCTGSAGRPAAPAVQRCPTLPGRAVIYLVHPKRVPELRDSLVLLFKNFLAEFRYQVLLFHEGALDEAATSAFLAQALPPQHHCLVRFLRTTFELPPGFDQEKALRKGVVTQDRFPGYQHMCAFWFKNVFEHPEVARLEYYWRMDTDSSLLHPVNYDIFDLFHRKGYKYGYYKVMTDGVKYVNGLWAFFSRYLQNRNVPVPPTLELPEPMAMPTSDVPVFYNNFEIVHIRTMLQPGPQDFIKAVFDTWRIYTHRWGDAPLRYLLINTFLNVSQEVHHCCDLKYIHPPLLSTPVDCCDDVHGTGVPNPCAPSDSPAPY
eukprot:EG_transcript_4350